MRQRFRESKLICPLDPTHLGSLRDKFRGLIMAGLDVISLNVASSIDEDFIDMVDAVRGTAADVSGRGVSIMADFTQFGHADMGKLSLVLKAGVDAVAVPQTEVDLAQRIMRHFNFYRPVIADVDIPESGWELKETIIAADGIMTVDPETLHDDILECLLRDKVVIDTKPLLTSIDDGLRITTEDLTRIDSSVALGVTALTIDPNIVARNQSLASIQRLGDAISGAERTHR